MELKKYNANHTQVLKINQIVRTISETHKFDKDKLIAINTSDVENGVMGNGTLTFVDELKGQFKKTIVKDDILFSEIRPANRRFAKVTTKNTKDYVVSTKLMVLRKYNEDVDLEYFYYCLTNQPFLDILQRRAENRIGSFPQITFDLLSEYAFPIPPISEQKRISSVISTLDKKIALNRQINQNLEAMAKQLYDYWFVQFDFPNEDGKPYKSSGGAMVWNEKLKRRIPEGWNVMSINEICTSCRGVSYGKDDLLSDSNGVLVLRGNNIENNRIVYDSNVAFVPNDFVSEEQHIKEGDIIMTMSSGSKAHVGKCAMFHKDSEHTFGAFLSKFTPKKELRYMTFLFLTSEYFKSLITAFCNGTGINNLTNQTFDDVLLVLPDKNKTRMFESKVNNLFTMIGNNEENMRKLTKQRDELLPLLMNGQVSVNSDLSVYKKRRGKVPSSIQNDVSDI